MLDLQLYVEGQQVELHDNESITLTQTLQNVRDIEKIFTDFTRTFNVPASKVNNKIFKHFYNFNIKGFDARNKKDAELTLNYQTFKTGKVKLEGVQMSNNEPVNYRLTFYGKAVNLKDLIGDDKLDVLTMIQDFVVTYDADTIIDLMQNPLTVNTNGEEFTDGLLVPLITHTDRLYYDSTENVQNSNNLHGGGSNNKGVDFKQLKPAIRLYVLIKAIERQYGLQFSDDFFNKTNAPFYNLYMWMHRKKGGVLEENETTKEAQFTDFGDFRGDSQTRSGFGRMGYQKSYHPDNESWRLKVLVNTEDTTNYSFVIRKNGEEWFREDDITGDGIFIDFSGDYRLASGTDYYTFHVITEADAEFRLQAIIRKTIDRLIGSDTYYGHAYSTITTSTDIDLYTGAQLPQMKVIDLLTGVFKMFNLTAYQDGDKIAVRTLDSFYASSTDSYDITKYLDTTSSEVNAIMPYGEIEFTYAGNESFFSAKHEELTKLSWGTAHFNNKGIYEGGMYKVELPFEHHKYERLLDVGAGNTKTTAQWGWSVDDSQDPYLGKPLLFYAHKITGGTEISVRKTTGTRDKLTTYHIPSNRVDPTATSQSINFNAEVNEYTYQSERQTLFSTYYQTYITDTFDIDRRLSKFKAYLPISILLSIKLQDKIIVFGNLYKINSLITNFETGLSELELINEVTDFTIQVNETSAYLNTSNDEGNINTINVSVDAAPYSI